MCEIVRRPARAPGTQLGVAATAVSLALFLRVHDVKPGAARRHLETTQREAFDEALRWVDSNVKIVSALRAHQVAGGRGVRDRETKGLLARP